MGNSKRRAGIIQITTNAERLDAKGNFSYNLGKPKRESIIGSDRTHGYKEKPQVAFVEGEITDSAKLSLAKLVTLEDATVVLQLAVGPDGPAKAILLKDAYYVGEGTGNSEEGNIPVRFESEEEGKEIKP